MKQVLFIILLFIIFPLVKSQYITPYELSGKKRSANYLECTNWYKKMVANFPNATLDSIGYGDIGKQIYVCKIVAPEFKSTRKVKILINNNIHPGEPEGTDASMLLVRELLTDVRWKNILLNVEIHIICQYNVDGTLNRNCCSRANQDGPEELGFRANARNLDLNRDFIKMDSRNSESFVNYFVKNNFHMMIDNHTSNGADYQYTLTYFHTAADKLSPFLKPVLTDFNTKLRIALEEKNWPSSPYVETIKTVPDSGIAAFWDIGRYATGFAALHHCMGFTVETHMLKPFPQRVNATLAFMQQFLIKAAENKDRILEAYQAVISNRNYPLFESLQMRLDMESYNSISFKGFEFIYKKSNVTGMDRLYYDRNKPFEKKIKYFNHFISIDSAAVPAMYIIPFAWKEVIKRLEMNGVKIVRLINDTVLSVNAKYIISFESVKNPYEGHYLHYNIKTMDTIIRRQFYQGDYIVPTKQFLRSFVVSVLEPRAPDSYFAWNFFDGVLMQKEGYSDYVFVDKAEEILAKYPDLKLRFEEKKKTDKAFAESSSYQLQFIYKNSEYYEKTVNLYPIFGLN